MANRRLELSTASPGSSLGRSHDHAQCVAEALGAAAAVCSRRGARLTELRRRVLEIVWGSHRPIGAYEILGRLAAEGRGAAPPTVYRALDFLLEQGLVHRIASRNAFLGCPSPGHPQDWQVLICRDCGHATEIAHGGVAAAIRSAAGDAGFAVERQMVEVLGRCRDCAPEPGT
jgi:Fur family zinc uptake transcriptional regulator